METYQEITTDLLRYSDLPGIFFLIVALVLLVGLLSCEDPDKLFD